MSFWENNKLFVIVGGIVLAVFLYLWPTLLGEWLAPWRGPVVVRPHSRAYADLQRQHRQRKKDIDRIYYPKGQAQPIADAVAEATDANLVLLTNYQEMHRWMSFVPRFPFRIPELRKDKNERQRYVSLAYTYAREGEFPCPEFEIRDPADGVAWLAATRNIGLGDPYFGLRNMEAAGQIEDPETVIQQIALIHELGHLAIRAGVDEIAAIQPQEPYPWGIEETPVATAYPVSVHIKCDLPTLLRFVHALDGAHGLVTEIQDIGVAAEAAAPVKPKPPAPPDDDPDENAPPPAAAAAALREPATTLIIQVHGQPSLFQPGSARGNLKERFTLFRPDDKDPHRLAFVANAVVRRLLPGGKIEAELEDTSDHCFLAPDKTTRNVVRKGDFAATRFFLIRKIKVKSVDAEIEIDDDGFPEEVTPSHLDAELSVAAVRFHKPELPKAATKAAPGKKPPEKKRGFKKPGRRL